MALRITSPAQAVPSSHPQLRLVQADEGQKATLVNDDGSERAVGGLAVGKVLWGRVWIMCERLGTDD